MKKYTNNWITAIDTAADNTGARLVFETYRNGEIVELTTEYWELNAKGEFELYEVEHGDERSEAFSRLLSEQQQELIKTAIENEDEHILFVA